MHRNIIVLAIALTGIALINSAGAKADNDTNHVQNNTIEGRSIFGKISSEDLPIKDLGQPRIKFEGATNNHIKFENDNFNDEVFEIGDDYSSLPLADVEINDVIYVTPATQREAHKIKFEDYTVELNINDAFYETQNNAPIVFKDQNPSGTEIKEVKVTKNQIKFEGSSQSEYNLNPVNEILNQRIKFEDTGSNSKEPLRKKKKVKRGRKYKLPNNQVENNDLANPNIQYPGGIGYPGYPNSPYPGINQEGHPVYPQYPPASHPSHPGYDPSYSIYQNNVRPTNFNQGLQQPSQSSGYGLQNPDNINIEQQQVGRPPRFPNTQYPGNYPSQNNQQSSKYPGYYGGLNPSGYPNPGFQHDPNIPQQGPSRYPGTNQPPRFPTTNGYGFPPGNVGQVNYLGYGYLQPGFPPQGSQANQPYPFRPGIPGQPTFQNGPIRTRKPKSLTQRAVSAVAEALTSIALYDDQQCVPRLLCEVAGGSTNMSPSLLKATASLQPLLTVLQGYSGISSSPLFVFGRAAVLGVTSKGNPTSCRYAYPDCPNDPVELVNYLNNHNGGFFRFFGQPTSPQNQQNLEQFYNQLSQLQQPQGLNQQGYGFHNPYFGYGLNQNVNAQNYGFNQYRNDDKTKNKAEERIQNKPADSNFDVEDLRDEGTDNSKWLFPDELSHTDNRDGIIENTSRRPIRGSHLLKFPDENNQKYTTKTPIDNTRYFNNGGTYFNGLYNSNSNYQTTQVNLNDYVFDYKHNFYVKIPKKESASSNTFYKVDNDKENTLYIVRGNGDPNHPEIVKLKPGQRA